MPNKKTPNFMNNRWGTMVYESSRILGNPLNELTTLEDELLKSNILNMNGKCEYCEEKDASTMDHFMCLVKHSKPTEYCNDTWNLIPCCKDCNSSKGGKAFKEWSESSGPKNPFRNMDTIKKDRITCKFKEYKLLFDVHHIVKVYDHDMYDDIMNDLKRALFRAQEQLRVLHNQTTYSRAQSKPNHRYNTRYIERMSIKNNLKR